LFTINLQKLSIAEILIPGGTTIVMGKTIKTSSNKKAMKTVKSDAKKTAKKNISKRNTDKTSSASKKQKKKTNLLKLCSLMNKYANDANDKEIIKRFKTTITSSVSEDISKISLFNILKKPEDINMNEFSESIQPYIKHYLFMYNRSLSKKAHK
jgi:hypothetical protein